MQQKNPKNKPNKPKQQNDSFFFWSQVFLEISIAFFHSFINQVQEKLEHSLLAK